MPLALSAPTAGAQYTHAGYKILCMKMPTHHHNCFIQPFPHCTVEWPEIQWLRIADQSQKIHVSGHMQRYNINLPAQRPHVPEAGLHE